MIADLVGWNLDRALEHIGAALQLAKSEGIYPDIRIKIKDLEWHTREIMVLAAEYDADKESGT